MKLRKHRVLALALCLVLAVSLLSGGAMAEGKTVGIIGITGIAPPIAGNHPSYTAELWEGGISEELHYDLSIAYNSADYAHGIGWRMIGAPNDAFMQVGYVDSVFRQGEIYQVELHLVPYDGYTFSQNPAVSINGHDVPAEDVSGDASHLTVVYAFPACRDSLVHSSVSLTVEQPRAGEAPCFRAAVGQDGAALDKASLQGHIDGVSWVDTASARTLGEDDKFEAGHSYAVLLKLKTTDGVHFKTGLSATVNGVGATVTAADSKSASVQFVFPALAAAQGGGSGYDFDCKGYTSCPQFTLFSDSVPYDHWAHAAIDWALIREVTNGRPDGSFGTGQTCTRGEVVTFLWRAAGRPEPKMAGTPFVDVSENDYFYKPVRWAVENGITNGITELQFGPGQTCSTAHIITFLYRAVTGNANEGYYEAAREWAVQNGLLRDTGLLVMPGEDCPREAVVTFLYRNETK